MMVTHVAVYNPRLLPIFFLELSTKAQNKNAGRGPLNRTVDGYVNQNKVEIAGDFGEIGFTVRACQSLTTGGKATVGASTTTPCCSSAVICVNKLNVWHAHAHPMHWGCHVPYVSSHLDTYRRLQRPRNYYTRGTTYYF